MIVVDNFSYPDSLSGVDSDKSWENVESLPLEFGQKDIVRNYYDINEANDDWSKLCNFVWFDYLNLNKDEFDKVSWSTLHILNEPIESFMLRAEKFRDKVDAIDEQNWLFNKPKNTRTEVQKAQGLVMREEKALPDEDGRKPYHGFFLFLSKHNPMVGGIVHIISSKNSDNADCITPISKRLIAFDTNEKHAMTSITDEGGIRVLYSNIWKKD